MPNVQPVTAGLLIALLAALGGCTRVSFPEPAADRGQIAVRLHGQVREGVTGPVTRDELRGYSFRQVSIEQGRQFERVNYDRIEDVVVIARGRQAPPDRPEEPATIIRLDRNGFDRDQYLRIFGDREGGRIELVNRRREAVTFYGFNENEHWFEQRVEARAKAEISIAEPGMYQILCEEDEEAHAVLHVVDGAYAWIGRSDRPAFFDDLAPGEYDLSVYAPRLPLWRDTVTVRAGERAEARATLSVNQLPDAR